MAFSVGRGSSSYSLLMVLLLTGLSALAWISTYSGMLQLIAASSADIGLSAKIAIGCAMFMKHDQGCVGFRGEDIRHASHDFASIKRRGSIERNYYVDI
jgi:hypothetical protein